MTKPPVPPATKTGRVDFATSGVRISRRQATAAALAPLLIPTPLFASKEGAKRLRLGVIGCGMRGKFLIANLPNDAQVVSLCDCSQRLVQTVLRPKGQFAQRLARFASVDGPKCSSYQDYRLMIEREELDAVIIAAPDHHHAQAAVLACRAGLHVYVEKPLAVTIAEGRAIVEAARKHQRVVQVGSQQRSMQVNRFACEFLRDGGLGKISMVEERNLPGPMPYQPDDYPAEEVPQSMEWDLFCGPTPIRPYNHKLWIKDAFDFGYLTWRGWDLFRDYSGHLMTNWGAHSIDMVQYALGMDDSGPTEIRPHPELIDKLVDDMWHDKTPPLGVVRDRTRDRMRFCPITMKYANGVELRFRPGVSGTVFHGERGVMNVGRNNYSAKPAGLVPVPDPKEQRKWAGEGHVARPHLANWLDAIRGPGQVNAPPEVGHRSVTVCHLANICRDLGRALKWDPKQERFQNDDEADKFLSRPRREGFRLE